MGFKKIAFNACGSVIASVCLVPACNDPATDSNTPSLQPGESNTGGATMDGDAGTMVDSSSGGSSGASASGNGGSPPGAGAMSEPLTFDEARSLYMLPIPGGNAFSCSTCHALEEPAHDDIVHVGHEIGTASTRTSYKNGATESMLEAVNSCLTEWMKLPQGWTEDSVQWQGLFAYLEGRNPGGGAPTTISYTIALPLAGPDAIGGDAVRGRELFNHACVVCHNIDGQGGGPAPSLDGQRLATANIEGPFAYAARRVRTSGPRSAFYPLLEGGSMPFWSEERLSDPDLLDIIAFVAGNVAALNTAPVDMEIPVRECEATHAKIGQTATLAKPPDLDGDYGVAGEALIIDDCTVQLRNFSYGGGGALDVRIYGGVGDPPDYLAGFSMSENILGEQPMNTTRQVQLPGDKTLDDLTGISVWCATVGQDFGSGTFAAP